MRNYAMTVQQQISLGLVLFLGHGALAAPPIERRARSNRADTLLAQSRRPQAQPSTSSRVAGKVAPQVRALYRGESTTLLPDGSWLTIGGATATGVTGVARRNINGDERLLTASLQRPRAFHSATLLPDASVLVLGGLDTREAVPVTEIYHSERQQFEALTFEWQPRAWHSATLLSDGRVLIAGGAGLDGRPTRELEIYDPRTRRFERLAAQLETARRAHVAKLLADGSVSITGGVDGSGNPVQTTERFLPESLSLTAEPSALELVGLTRLAASIPADQSDEVALDAVISMRFTRPLQVQSVNAGTVQLRDGQGPLTARVVPAEGGMLAFVTPEKAIEPNTTYTLGVNGLRDASGFTLDPLEISFTTAGLRAEANDRTQQGADKEKPEKEDPKPPDLPAPDGVTALYGHVRTIAGKYLPSVTMKLDCQGKVTIGRTDNLGRFLLQKLPAGRCELEIDGTTANDGKNEYGRYFPGVDIVAGRTNVLPYTIWMTPLDKHLEVTIPSPTPRETVITHPKLRGFELRLPPNAVVRDHNGEVVTKLGITPVPVARPPFPLPPVSVPIYFTIQPGGAYIEVGGSRYNSGKGAQLWYPNTYRAPAGARFEFWDYEPEGRGWYIYGTGRVDARRKQIVPDAGVVLYRLTGAMVVNPERFTPPTGPNQNCGDRCRAGDPVDLATGLLIYEQTDLAIPDVMPVLLHRTYRQADFMSRSFGMGFSQNFDLFLTGDTNPYTVMYLVQADGSRLVFLRISPGTGFADAVYELKGSSTRFNGAKIIWNSTNWKLTLKDGTTMLFPESAQAVRVAKMAVIEIKDRFGNRISLTRDPVNGNLTRITSPNGRWIALTYDAANRITTAKDNIGRTVTYEYDEGGRLVKVTNPANGVTHYTYDANNQMLTVKDPRNIVFMTNEYDDDGRVRKQTQADGGFFRFVYTEDSNGNVIQVDVTDPLENIERTTFDTNGAFSGGMPVTRIRAVGKPEQQTTTFEYRPGTSLTSAVIDPLLRRTTFDYDAKGNPTTVTRLAGTPGAVTSTLTYHPAFNKITSVTDALNHTTQFGYDANGNLTTITPPATTPPQNATTLTYTAAGQLETITKNPIGTVRFEYTGGLLSAVVDPEMNRSTRIYDGLGRTVTAAEPMQPAWRFEYDNGNRTIRVTDPLSAARQFSWDGNSNLLSVTDPRNGLTEFTYNNMNLVDSQSDPLLATETFIHDKNGNLTQHTDRKLQITGATYDALNRPLVVTYHDSSTATFTWDAVSRLRQVVDTARGTLTWDYDDLDRLTSTSGPRGTVMHGYDAAGKRETMTVPGQPTTYYTWDAANRLTQISQGTLMVSFTFDVAGRRQTMTLPNGVVATYGYNTGSRLQSISYSKNGTIIGDLTYGYDAAGRQTSMGGTLARVSLPPTLTSATYNAGNRLVNWAGTTLTYDNNGNLTYDGVNTYTWNVRDELSGITGGAVSATFSYDAAGNRLNRTVNGTTTGYLLEHGNVVQEQSAGGAVTANLLTGGVDEVFSRSEAGGSSTFLTDGLGSTLALLDNAGTAQTIYTYEPFGFASASGAGSGNAFVFTGRENDGTGLMYYRARYYSPRLQRFISEDPIGFAGGDVNLYGYVGQSPTNATDPSGEVAIPIVGGLLLGGLLIGGLATLWCIPSQCITRPLDELRELGRGWPRGTPWDLPRPKPIAMDDTGGSGGGSDDQGCRDDDSGEDGGRPANNQDQNRQVRDAFREVFGESIANHPRVRDAIHNAIQGLNNPGYADILELVQNMYPNGLPQSQPGRGRRGGRRGC